MARLCPGTRHAGLSVVGTFLDDVVSAATQLERRTRSPTAGEGPSGRRKPEAARRCVRQRRGLPRIDRKSQRGIGIQTGGEMTRLREPACGRLPQTGFSCSSRIVWGPGENGLRDGRTKSEGGGEWRRPTTCCGEPPPRHDSARRRTRSIRGLPRRTNNEIESKSSSTVRRSRLLLVIAAAVLCMAASRFPQAKAECSAAPAPAGAAIAVGHTDARSPGARPRGTRPTFPVPPGDRGSMSAMIHSTKGRQK